MHNKVYNPAVMLADCHAPRCLYSAQKRWRQKRFVPQSVGAFCQVYGTVYDTDILWQL